MRHWIPTLLIAALPATALAQSVVGNNVGADNAPPSLFVDQLLSSGTTNREIVSASQVMPLWSTPDGHVLAMMAIAENGVPALPRSPQIGSVADWQWVDVTNFVSAGLLLRSNTNLSSHIAFSGGNTATNYALPGVLCNRSNSLDSGTAACAASTPSSRYGAVHLGTDLALNDTVGVDLSYGLSWLRRDITTLPSTNLTPAWDLLSGSGTGILPTLIIPGAELANIQNSGVSALTHWRLNDDGETLNLGASLGRVQLSGIGNIPLANFNQATVGLGLHYGSFSGTVIGRVLGPADPINGTQRWSGLDLGISWRTPWQGEFSVGAQNLWSSGSLPTLAEPASAREIDPNQARVPYVQYHQDL